MAQSAMIKILQDAIYTILLVSAPMLITGLVIGVVISILQATTQINEQTMVFIPKIVGIFLSIIIFGQWMMTKLVDFTVKLFDYINTIIK